MVNEDHDDWLYVLGGYVYTVDMEPGEAPCYTIVGLFDNEEAAMEAAHLLANQFGQYIEGIEIDAFPRNLMTTPGSDVTGLLFQ